MAKYPEGQLWGCIHDLMDDAPKYLADARKAVEKDCSGCSGTGKIPLPSGPALMREFLLAAMVEFGAQTAHRFPGEECPFCEGTGKFVDEKAARIAASVKATKDWETVIREAIEADDRAKVDNAQFGVGA